MIQSATKNAQSLSSQRCYVLIKILTQEMHS